MGLLLAVQRCGCRPVSVEYVLRGPLGHEARALVTLCLEPGQDAAAAGGAA